MASYSLKLDTKFNPFTYAEMLQPVAAATQAHQVLEDAYSEMETKASVWENMANQQADPLAYKMYKGYADDLEARAEDLMRNGLNIKSRRGMMEMKSRYSKEILPIEVAYKRREELAKELRTNPDKTTFYQRDARTMSLDDFIKNPALDYGESYSGAMLYKQVHDIATDFKNVLTKKGKLTAKGLPYQYEQLLQYGYTPEDIQLAITDPKNPKAVPVLNTIVELALASSGMAKWASKDLMEQARAWAVLGLSGALGTTTIKDYTDTFSMNDELNRRLHERTVAAQERANRIAQGNLPINIDELVSPNQLGADASKNALKALETLGVKPGSKTITRRTQLAVVESGRAVAIQTKDGKGFKLWNDNGTLMTKSQFVNANKNNLKGDQKIQMARLEKWYQKEINEGAYRSLGYTGSQVVRHNDVLTRASNITSGKGAVTMSAMRINLGTNSDKVLQALVELSRNGDNTAIREVKSFNESGELSYNGKAVKVKDLLTDDGKLKGSTVPIFYAHQNANADALLMKYNGKMYAIPKKYLGSIGSESYGMDVPALLEAYAMKLQLIAQYGKDAYYDSKEGQALEGALDNYGAAYLRAIITAAGATYNPHSYDVYESSDSKM